MSDSSDVVRHVFVTGLRNAHALEHRALSLMDRQIEHFARYAEVENRLRSHRGETERQIARLDDILASLGESHSTVKDIGMSLSGTLAAFGRTFAPDENVKNSLANFAFDNFEAASYEALIPTAEEGGFRDAVPLLRQSLQEELAMVAFRDDILPVLVREYISLRVAGEKAGH